MLVSLWRRPQEMDWTPRPYKHMLMQVWGTALYKGREWQEVQTG